MKLHWLAGAALALACATPARAEFEIGYAHIDEIDGETSRGLVASWLRPVQRWPKAGLQTELFIGGIAGRDSQLLADDRQDNYFAGVGLRKHFGGFFVGAGLAAISQKTTLLSSAGQFVTSIGWARGHYALAFRHISNADTGGNNDGENLLSLSYRW